MTEAPVYNDSIQFAKWLSANLQNDHPAARRTHEAAVDLVEHIHLALCGFETPMEVESADRSTARLRALLRLSRELGLISDGALLHGARLLEGIGRQLGGWQRKMQQATL